MGVRICLTTAVNQAGYRPPDYHSERSAAHYGQVIQFIPRLPRSTIMRPVARVLALVLALTASVSSCFAAEPKLKSGDYVAVIGDSITEQRLYSLFIEDYLLMCKPALDLRATQFGWAVRRPRAMPAAWPTTPSAFGRTWPRPASA